MLKDKVKRKNTGINYQNMSVEEVQKARTNGLIGESLAGQVIMAKLTSCKYSVLPFVVELRRNKEEHRDNIMILRKRLYLTENGKRNISS